MQSFMLLSVMGESQKEDGQRRTVERRYECDSMLGVPSGQSMASPRLAKFHPGESYTSLQLVIDSCSCQSSESGTYMVPMA